ncbi:hypothetical protein AB0M41_14985 [Streptomyces sp. NPDC051896]
MRAPRYARIPAARAGFGADPGRPGRPCPDVRGAGQARAPGVLVASAGG